MAENSIHFGLAFKNKTFAEVLLKNPNLLKLHPEGKVTQHKFSAEFRKPTPPHTENMSLEERM